MQQLDALPSFPETPDVIPPTRFVKYPPRCVVIHNVVAQAHFNTSFDGDKMMREYFYCRRNTKNSSSVILQTYRANASAGMYGANAMMMITGSNVARKSRYAADAYMDMMRKAGIKGLRIMDFVVINFTANVAYGSTLDIAKYRHNVCTNLTYTPDGFPGARKWHANRAYIQSTMYFRNMNMLGSRNTWDLCLDAIDELERMTPFFVPMGSEDEDRIHAEFEAQSRRKKPKLTDDVPEPHPGDDGTGIGQSGGAGDVPHDEFDPNDT